jgi:activating signal cointegrator complex subunit 3
MPAAGCTSVLHILQVRHNEDIMNIKLSEEVRWKVDPALCGDPHTKANLLLQAHFSRLALPIADYATDTRGVLDNMMRLLQATVDLASGTGWLRTAVACIHIMQVCTHAVQRLVHY